MKKGILLMVIVFSILSYALLSYLKIVYLLPNKELLPWNLWLIEFLIFSISFTIPLIVGSYKSRIESIKSSITNLKEISNIDNYNAFCHLYAELQEITKNFTKYRFALHEELIFPRFSKPILDFFYREKNGVYLDHPELIKSDFNYLVESINIIETESSIPIRVCPNPDKYEIIEKAIAICCFYEYYYSVDISSSLVEFFNRYSDRISGDNEYESYNLSLLQNGFQFDSTLIDIQRSDILKSELSTFIEIKNHCLELAKTINDIKQDFDIITIFNLYKSFFDIGLSLAKRNALLQTLFHIEFSAFYNYLRFFNNLELSDSDFSNLNNLHNQNLRKCKHLGEYIDQYFYHCYRLPIRNLLNYFFSKHLRQEERSNYHPIFNLYYALNSKSSTGIDYIPRLIDTNEFLKHMKNDFKKDIHIWFINEMNYLIQNGEIEEAEEIYLTLDFDQIHHKVDSTAIYKYSILLCKAVFQIRIGNSYQFGIETLEHVIQNTQLFSDLRDARNLIFGFAFEKGDIRVYKPLYKSSDEKTKKQMIFIARKIRVFGSWNNIEIGNWVYVSYPSSSGFAYRILGIPSIIKGG